MKVLEQTGLSSADELLYPENYYYLSDILSYAAIGARSVEDQQHRLIASGLDVPVGMKNPTSGDLSVMMNAILAAQHPHTFLFSQWEVHSKGYLYPLIPFDRKKLKHLLYRCPISRDNS